MLYLYEDHLVELVREKPYSNIVTVMVTNRDALALLAKYSKTRATAISHYLYRGAVHIADNSLPLELSDEQLDAIEVVDRVTPEPVAFYYEYDVKIDGEYALEYGYCWAEEAESRLLSIQEDIEDLRSEPVFFPLFRIPRQLVSVNRTNTSGNSGDETNQ